MRPFSIDCSKLEAVPFVDAVVAYDCPNTLEIFVLVVRNGLYVHSMMSNLIPLFVMREAGFKLNGVTNILISQILTLNVNIGNTIQFKSRLSHHK